MYSIEFSNQSKKFLKNLDKHISVRIVERIEKLKENPYPSDVKFIGREGREKVFRYRIGDYRALYSINENNKMIFVMKIDKRPRVYD